MRTEGKAIPPDGKMEKAADSMEAPRPKIKPRELLPQTEAGRVVCWRRARQLILLIFALGVPVAGQATDSYSEVIAKHLELTQNPDVVEQPVATDPNYNGLVLTVALLLAARFVTKNSTDMPKALSNFWNPPAEASNHEVNLLELDPSLAAFFTALRDGLNASPGGNGAVALDSVNGVRSEKIQEFFDSAPNQLATLRTLCSELARPADEADRQERLVNFRHEVRRLRDLCQMVELRPIWLMACALEGLLKQLSTKLSNLTPSVLGTVVDAVELLEILCVRNLKPNLASEPPIRILAVDDDPVSRMAISFALKKAFNEPCLAPEAQAALVLAARQTYDVIFLDVEMPGMDGFELCTKIHETDLNRTTPVVFVTSHGDFDSRARATLSGGVGLIAKPFLPFEITVKALTLALGARLQNGTAESVAAAPAAFHETAPPKAAAPSETSTAIALSARPATVPAASQEEVIAQTGKEKGPATKSDTVKTSQPSALSPASPLPGNASATGDGSREFSDRNFSVEFQPSVHDFANAFFTHAPAHIEELRSRLAAAKPAAEPAELQELLGELYVGVHTLNSEAERAELRSISRLVSALQGMLKKLLEHAKFCTPSTLTTAAAALELLEELCRAGCNPDLANPPIRLLVVDDDPIARRAVSGSIQLAFGRPESAESGEAALALAAENPFDLIFLDVLMPGIGGFTTCSRIRETGSNRNTPVVFITSHDDMDSRAQAAASGGCGFIPKPVLSSQITLTAFTYILRARLGKFEPAPAHETSACLAIA